MVARLQNALALALILAGCAATPPNDAEIEKLAKAEIESQKVGICNIHHVRMQRRLVPVQYADLSLAYFSSDYSYAKSREFPNAREYVLSPDPAHQARHEKVRHYVCSECKRAERQWMVKHPHDEWAKTFGPE